MSVPYAPFVAVSLEYAKICIVCPALRPKIVPCVLTLARERARGVAKSAASVCRLLAAAARSAAATVSVVHLAPGDSRGDSIVIRARGVASDGPSVCREPGEQKQAGDFHRELSTAGGGKVSQRWLTSNGLRAASRALLRECVSAVK